MDFNPDTCFRLLQNCLDRVQRRPLTIERLFAARSLKTSFLKKWLPPDSSSLDSLAKQVFLTCNSECSSFVVKDDPSTDLGQVVTRMRADLHRSFHCGELQSNILDLQACLAGGKCGPGSSVGTKRTDFFGKMCASTLSYTDVGLYHLYKNNTNQAWFDMERHRSEHYGEVCVEGSNSTTVPKDRNINRVICTEPSLNMFFQLGAGVVIEGPLKRVHNIDLSTQPNINKALAREGSINGKFATIDLKNASNTICSALVKYLLPPQTYMTLDKIRSHKTKVDGRYYKLEMFSSMGNGFTFPLQTLIFASLVRATYEHLGITPRAFGKDRNYGVFGDDIVCVASAYDKIVEMLNGCGFEVNLRKSFNLGAFRESCGGDYFRGTDVRGVYLRSIASVQDIYSIFNRLARWSIKHRVDLSEVLDYLLGLADFRPVPFDAGDTAGFKCPRSTLKKPKYDKAGLLMYKEYRAVANIKAVSGISIENREGMLIAYLGGYLTNSFRNSEARRKKKRRSPVSRAILYENHREEHHFTERSLLQVEWKIVKSKTPSWDFIPHVGLKIQDYELIWMNLDYS